jgi:O-antigen/teichoic acid export membrane protein
MLPSDSHGRVLRQSAVILAFGWALAPLQFLTAVIVARAVGPEGKGALALLTGLIAILASVAGLGIPSGAAVLYRQQLRSRAEVIGTALALTVTSSVLLFGVFLWGGVSVLRALLSDRDLAMLQPEWILLALIAVVPTALSSVADVILIAANAMRLYAVRTAMSGLLGVAITWILTLHLGWGVAGALASYPVAAGLGLVVFGYWWRHQDDLGPVAFTGACSRALLRVGVQQHAIAIIALFAKRLDVFLIASMLTLPDAGFYAAGILIPQAIISIPRATMWPLVASLSTKGTEVPDAVAQVSRLQLLLMAIGSLALWPLAPTIVSTLFGEAFTPSTAPFRWALLGLPFTPVTITVNAILTARSRPGLSIFSALVGAGAQLFLTILLIPTWGTSAGAAALSANFITTALIQLVIVRSQGVSVLAMVVPTRRDFADLAKTLRARVRA